MGDPLAAPSGDPVTITAHVTDAPGATFHWLLDGKPLASAPPQSLTGSSAEQTAHWTSDGQRHWLRAEVRTADGTLQLLSNPIFFNWKMRP